MAEEIKDTEVKEETAEATVAAEKAEETLAMKKLTALKELPMHMKSAVCNICRLTRQTCSSTPDCWLKARPCPCLSW